MNKKLRFVYFLLFTILSLTVTTLILIVYSGYRIDFKYMRLVKTGSLYINTNPSKTEIYLNDKKIPQKTPSIINQLTPGEYNLKLVKTGYKTWEQKVDITESITSFVNYDLVLADIELSPTNEFGENTYYSHDNKYISYVKKDIKTSLNDIYIYDVLAKQSYKVYSTDKKIKSVVWSKQNDRLLLDMNDKFFILNISINIVPLINQISSENITNLSNYVANIDSVFFNENNSSKLIIKSKDSLYSLDLNTEVKSNKLNNFTSNSLVYINDDIYYIQDSKIINYHMTDDSIYTYDNFPNITKIVYNNEYFILSDKEDSLTILKDLKSDPVKLNGKNIKIDKNYFISWNDYEFNAYDKKEKAMKFTTRYSQKILDVDFYSKNYAILILEKDIKLINIGDNVNELNVISNKNNINKVISFDNKAFVVYREDGKNIISNLSLQ